MYAKFVGKLWKYLDLELDKSHVKKINNTKHVMEMRCIQSQQNSWDS